MTHCPTCRRGCEVSEVPVHRVLLSSHRLQRLSGEQQRFAGPAGFHRSACAIRSDVE